MKFNKIKFSKDKLNICQVSLRGNMPIIINNYQKLKLYYENFNIFIVCPKKDFKFFKKKLRYKEFVVVSEDQIISFSKFEKIFSQLSKKYRFKILFKKRLFWYYQQVLKLAFAFYFLQKFHKKLVLWDADTIIAKKIEFFSGDFSKKFGTFTEFHKSYFEINKVLLGKLPKYFISSVVQFGSITKNESKILMNKLRIKRININSIARDLSVLIMKKIFYINGPYNGSLFSEYELIGNSNILAKPGKQKLIANLRKGLKGSLSSQQLNFLSLLNITNVTYEHTHNNIHSRGMLKRKLNWYDFIIIVLKTKLKFYYNLVKHNVLFTLNIDKMS
tara:strand:+ start:156 stop:1148 length:993 start_codon:yes stop_codon:yes gene_type:complete